MIVIVTAAGVAGLLQAAARTSAHHRLPCATSGGTTFPDLNGIWQAVNEAHWDLETHIARPASATFPGPAGDVPAAPVLALGAIGGVPGGLGVVEGGSIPYRPAAAMQRQENFENALTRDPEVNRGRLEVAGTAVASQLLRRCEIDRGGTDTVSRSAFCVYGKQGAD